MDHTYSCNSMINLGRCRIQILIFIVFCILIPKPGIAKNRIGSSGKSFHNRNPLNRKFTTFKLVQDSVLIDTANTGGVVCSGNSTGTLSILANSNTGSNLSFSIDSGQNFQASNLFPGLSLGSYKVLVRDDLGNTAYYLADMISDSEIEATASSVYNCLGSNIQLHINAKGCTFSWSGPNGFSSTLNNPIINNAVMADSGIYSVTIQNPNCTEVFSVLVEVNNPPLVYNLNGAGTYCGTGYLFLQNNQSNIQYNLLRNGVYEGIHYNNYDSGGVDFQVQKSGDYTVVAYDLKTGCSIPMLGDALVTINPNPGQFNITGSGEYCLSDTLKLSASDPGVNYQLAKINPQIHGLLGQYYSNVNFNGSPQASRVDSVINFPDLYTAGILPAGIPNTYFSVHWSGFLKAPVSGNYTFYTQSDDGIKITLNGTTIIEDFHPHGNTSDQSSSINLTAGQFYYITIDYYNNWQSSVAQVFWSYPGQSTQIIPSSQWYVPNSYTLIGSTQSGGGSSLNFPVNQSGNYIILANGPAGCSSLIGGPDSVLIDPPPTTAYAGGNQTLCYGVNFVLSGNTPTVGMGLWTQVSGPNSASFINPYAAQTVVNGLIAGVYIFQWTITKGNCTSSSQVTITITSPPDISNAGPNQTICEGSIAILAGNNPVHGTGTWTQISGACTATITNPNDYNSTVTGLISGNYVFQWNIASGSCSTSSSRDSIVVTPGPSMSDAGPNQNLCNVSSTTLSGNTPLNGIGTWTQIGGSPVTVNDIFSPTTSITGLSPGSYTFEWTISGSSGGCSNSSRVTITVYSPTSISVSGPKQSLCNQNTAIISGNKPNIGMGTWSQVSGPNSAILAFPDSSNTQVSGLIAGSYIFQWSISNGICSPSVSFDTLNIYSNPSLSEAGINQNLCNVNQTHLSGNTPLSGTGSWSQVSGPNLAGITNPGSPSSSITGLIPGIYVFNWAISSANCSVSNSTVSIQVSNLASLSNAGPNQILCNLSSTLLNGNVPVSGKGVWTELTGPNIANIVDTNLYNSPINGLIPGIYTFQWTINSGACTSNSSSVLITIYAAPSQSIAGPPQTFCNSGFATISANAPTVGSGLWTQVSGPSTPLIPNPDSPNNNLSSLIPGTYIFSWTISNGPCTSSSSNDTLVIQNPPTTATTHQKQVLCDTNLAILIGNTPLVGVGTWTQLSGPNTSLIVNPNSPQTQVSGLIPGTYIFNWAISNGICPVSNAPDTLIINPITNIKNPGTHTTYCNINSVKLSGPNPGIGTGVWTQISGPNTASISFPYSTTSFITGLVSGTYVFRWTITQGACYISTTQDTLDINPSPSISNAGTDQVLCNTSIANLSGNIPQSGSGIWSQISGPNIAHINNPGSYNTQLSGLIPGKYVFQWTISQATCSSSFSTMSILVSDSLKANIIQVTDILCSGQGKGSATVQGSGGIAPYQYTWNTVPVQTGSTANNLDSGTYILTLTDSIGCSNQVLVKISEPSPIILQVQNPNPVIPPLTVDITQDSLIKGSTPGLNFTYFQDSAANQILANPKAVSLSGIYYIKGSNGMGCYKVKPIQVIIKPLVLPVPVSDSGITQAGKSIILPFITRNDIQGTYSIDPTSIDLDPSQPGIQSMFTVSGEGFFSLDTKGNLVFFPFGNFSGVVYLNYTVSDIFGNRSTNSAQVSIQIFPLAGNDTLSLAWNTSMNVSELSKGKGRLNPSTVQIAQSPLHGTYSINPQTGNITYTPNKNYFGLDSLLYTVCDSTLPKPLCSNPGVIQFIVYSISDVSIQKTAPSQVDNDVFNYTLIVSNSGPGDAHQISVIDTLPGNMVLVSSNKDNPDFNTQSKVLTWNIASLANGRSDTLVITVNTPDLGSITNFAHVKAKEVDLNLSNNFSGITIHKIGEILFFPTLFTPNGDGVNDNFEIRGLEDYPENEIHIFNRWGNEVYHATEYMRGGRIWNGSNLDAGTYFYVLNVVVNGQGLRYSGYTTLIRTGK